MEFTRINEIPGFIPILGILASPLPTFLITLSLTTIPFFVVNLSLSAQYADLFRMLHSDIDSQVEKFTNFWGWSSSHQNEFDFVVVGGGTSGSVIAASLSEHYKVLLIEAGGDPHGFTYVPYISTKVLNLAMINWQFKTEPLNSSGYVWPDQRMAWPSGRSLGGSSNSNNMIYMRGNPQDFNSWAEHTGDDRWSYNNVEQIFKRIENYHGHWEGSANHGEGGPMHIEKVKFGPSAKYWLEAGKELGKRSVDPNAFQSEGFSPLDVFQKDGTRFSAFRGYIEPNLNNPNLTIHRYSIATKIHFDDSMRAVGVTYYRHANKRYASAKNEIIISCGAINTPKLLMNSGIGDQVDLEIVDIKSLVDIPVGENLQVHGMAIVGPFLLNKNVSFLKSRDLTPLSGAEYLALGKGPLASPGGIAATGLISSTRNQNKNWPDISLTHVGLGVDKDIGYTLETILGMKKNGPLSSFLQYNAMNDSNFVFVSLGKPKSRGFVRLDTKDPFDYVHIIPNFFSDEGSGDLDALIDGIQFAVKIYENTATFNKLGARLAPNHFPGCESHELKSRPYWECYIRQNMHIMGTPGGTCQMGKKDDPSSVVDSELRIIGTKGIRIADASIMPFITNSDLTAPTLMIGEMCADFIKRAWPINNGTTLNDGA